MMTRQEALIALLTRYPSTRAYRSMQCGKPGAELVKRDLGRAYLAHRMQEHKDASTIVDYDNGR